MRAESLFALCALSALSACSGTNLRNATSGASGTTGASAATTGKSGSSTASTGSSGGSTTGARGTTGTTSTSTSSSGSSTGGTGGHCPAEVPLEHRPVQLGCDGGIVPDAGVTCAVGADCQCQTDADCPPDADAGMLHGGVCSCAPNHSDVAGGSALNFCLPANCRVDSDCACGACSPSVDISCALGTAGYYCHTPQDVCVNDSDCDGGYCAYAPQVGHWACGYGFCSG